MDESRFGAKLRMARVRLGLRQVDVAEKAGTSRSTVSRAERGALGELSVALVERLADAVECWFDGDLRSRQGQIERLMSAGHAALGEAVIARIGSQPGWMTTAEVSFAFGREAGIIDVLAIHAATGRLVLIELKTTVYDVNEHLATIDRKRRLATRVAVERGWTPSGEVSVWLIVSDTRTNRRAVSRHRALIASQLPADGRSLRRSFSEPGQSVSGVAFWPDSRPVSIRHATAASGRVRKPREEPASGSRDGRCPDPVEIELDIVARRVLRGAEGASAAG